MGNADSKPKSEEEVAVDDLPTDNSASPTKPSFSHKNDQSPKRKSRDKMVYDQARDDENVCSTIITDDQVQVNLAMADLMAYLQVVANNTQNLPITRRDDPEIENTVSNLSSEDYARKSAAFIPSDVRMIGGTFTRYGRVWDLPTCEVRSDDCDPPICF